MAGFQVTAPQGTDADTHQLLDAQAEAGEHLAHLALQTLLQHHAGAARRQTGYVLGLGLTLRDADTLEQLDEHAAVESRVKRDPVFFLNPTAGVSQTLAHAAVVRKEDETFTVGIEAAYVVCVAVLGGQQVIYSADGTLRIAAAHIATRLVQQNHHFFLRHGAAAVHSHKVSRHYAQTGSIHGLAVHFHAAFGNESVRGAAAFVAARCQKLIQAHAALRGCGVAVIFRHDRFLYVKLR